MENEPMAAGPERRDIREKAAAPPAEKSPPTDQSPAAAPQPIVESPVAAAAQPRVESEKSVDAAPSSDRPSARPEAPPAKGANEKKSTGDSPAGTTDSPEAGPAPKGAYEGGRGEPKAEPQRESIKTPFEPLPPETQKRIETTFVESLGFRAFERRLEATRDDARLICVAGSKNSGRFTSAWKIGLHLAASEHRPDRVFRLSYADRRRHVLDALHDCDLESDAVYVVRDLFDGAGAMAQLSSEVVDELNRLLRKKKAWVVATVLSEDTTTRDEIDRLPVLVSGNIDRERVFRTHLAWYASPASPCRLSLEAKEAVELRWNEISELFGSPVQVASFCLSFARDPNCDLLRLARSICRVDWATMREWFDGLAIEERLYALMVVLFEELDPSDLDAVFVSCLRQLRAKGMEARDPRLIDFGELRRRLRIDEQSNRFASAANAQYVEQRVKGHLELLASVIEEVINGLPMLIDRTARRYREAVGAAIGRVVVHDVNLFRRTITALADSPIAEISRAVGYVVREASIVRAELDTAVREIFIGWAASRDFDHVWTAAASIPMVAEATVERKGTDSSNRRRRTMETIEEVIRSIAGNVRSSTDPLSQSVRDTLKNSLAALSKTHPETVVTWLVAWLALDRRDADDPSVASMWNLAFGAANQIFASVKDATTLTKERDSKLLDLLPALLIAHDEEWDDDRTLIDLLGNAEQQMQIDRLLEFAARWIDDPRWPDLVEESLLEAISKGGKFVRLRIVVHVLARWMDTSNPVRRSIAMRIVARSRAVDGAVIDLPTGAIGILLTETDKDRSIFGDTVEFVASCLESQVSLERRLLGHRGESASASFRTDEIERVRLAYPAVEDLRGSRSGFMLIVHTVDEFDFATRESALVDAVHDIDDLKRLDGACWSDRIEPVPVITSGTAGAEPDAVRSVSANRAAREILDRADALISKVLDARSPAEWRDMFRSAGYPEIADAPRAQDVLDIAGRWLDVAKDAPLVKKTRDVVAAISPVVQFAFRLDIDATLTVLDHWMATETLRVECAVACARSLVRSSRLRLNRKDSPASPQDIALFKLGPALAKANASEAVAEWCRLIESVVEKSAAESPSPTDGIARSLGPTVENAGGRARVVLEGVLDSWAKRKDPKDPLAALRPCAERMRYRIQFGRRSGAHRTLDGGTLVAIVVDSADLASSADLRDVLKSVTESATRAKTKMVVFRLGDSQPIAFPDSTVEAAKIAAEGSLRFARLIGPIVDKLPESIERIIYVGSGDVRDKDDFGVAFKRRLIAVGRKNVLAADEFIPMTHGAAQIAERIRKSLATHLTKGAAAS